MANEKRKRAQRKVKVLSNLTGRPIYKKGQKPAKVKAIRDAARDKSCKFAIPGTCTHDNYKTVGCHMRYFNVAGMGQKPDDIFIIDGCDRCHEVTERRSKWEEHGVTWELILMAFMETLQDRRASGDVILKGE